MGPVLAALCLALSTAPGILSGQAGRVPGTVLGPEETAAKLMDIMDYPMAIEYYRHLIDRDSNRKGLRTEVAFALIRLGRFPEAEPLAREESERFPRERKPLVLLACLGLWENDCAGLRGILSGYDRLVMDELRKAGWERVAEGIDRRSLEASRVRTLMAKEPNLGFPYYALAYCLKRACRFDQARQGFERASRMGYDLKACRLQLVDIALEAGDGQGALTLLGTIGGAPPAEPEYAFLEGCAWHDLGDDGRAVSSFRRVCEIRPHWTEALENLARLLSSRGEASEAASLRDRIRALSSGKRDAPKVEDRAGLTRDFVADLRPVLRDAFRRGKDSAVREADARFMESIQKGALNEAAEYLGEFLRLHEGDASLTFKLANLLNELGCREEALDQAERVLALERDHKGAWDLRGDILFRIGDFAHALWPYEEVVRLAPGDAMAHYNLGCAQAATGAEKEAAASWRKVLQLNKPRLREKSDREGAGDILRYDVDVFANPPAFHARLALGRLYSRQGLAARAAEELGEAIRLVPGDPDPYFDLGAACLKLGDGTKAASCFKTYLALGGKREQEARAFLGELE